MKQTYQTLGAVDHKGALKVYRAELDEFLNNHKGKRIILRVEVLGDEPSTSLKAYYYKVVVQAFVQALWESGTRKTCENVEYTLRTFSPIMLEETFDKDGRVHRRVKRIEDLTSEELCEHIETLKQIAAEDFGIYIEDPRTLK